MTDKTSRKFGPKTADHPSVGMPCPACRVPFKEGDYTVLMALGPGADPEAQRKAREGRPYNAVAIEIHYACGDPVLPRVVHIDCRTRLIDDETKP